MSGIATAIALAGLGATIGTALHAKKVSKQQMADEKKMLADQKSRQAFLDSQFGRPLMGQGQENMGLVQNHLRQLASGDRSAAMQAMAPEINSMAAGQQGAVAAQRSLYPRGGQSASQAANLPYQLQGNVNNMLFGARRDAFGQLGQLGANQSSLGLSAMGQGAGLTNSMLQYGLDARNQQFNQGQAIGQGLGGFLQLAQQYNANRTPPANVALNPNAASGSYSGPGLFGYGGQPNSGNGAALGGGSTPSTNAYNTYSASSNPFSGGSFLGGKTT